MNEQEKKQLEAARKIVEHGNCSGFYCQKNAEACGLFGRYCFGWSDQAVEAAKAYIKDRSKISEEDLPERIEKLEEKVEGLEISRELPGRRDVEGAKKMKCKLEQGILDLVAAYEEETGLKVSRIDLKTGPFLFLDIFKREGKEQRNDITKRNHIVKVKVNL